MTGKSYQSSSVEEISLHIISPKNLQGFLSLGLPQGIYPAFEVQAQD